MLSQHLDGLLDTGQQNKRQLSHLSQKESGVDAPVIHHQRQPCSVCQRKPFKKVLVLDKSSKVLNFALTERRKKCITTSLLICDFELVIEVTPIRDRSRKASLHNASVPTATRRWHSGETCLGLEASPQQNSNHAGRLFCLSAVWFLKLLKTLQKTPLMLRAATGRKNPKKTTNIPYLAQSQKLHPS